MPDNSAGRIPFFVDGGSVVFGLVAEANRVIDKEYVRRKCGDVAASLVPKNMVTYGLPRGTIESGKSIEDAAGRESAEEIHYNATGNPVLDEDRKAVVPPHSGEITEYLEKTIDVEGKRGRYRLTLFVDRIEPYSFSLKSMEDKIEGKIKPRKGNKFQEGGKWGTVAHLEASAQTFRSLSKHRKIMANPEVRELIHSQLRSMESQLVGMKEIESDLVRILRAHGERVSRSGGQEPLSPGTRDGPDATPSEERDLGNLRAISARPKGLNEPRHQGRIAAFGDRFRERFPGAAAKVEKLRNVLRQ